MKRKDYEKPTMQVVELQHRTMLLQASAQSNGQAGVQDYEWNDIDE